MSGRRRIIDDELYAHFVTFSADRRRRLLDHDRGKRIVLGGLNLVLERTAGRCVGFALMPDHVQAILWRPVVGRLRHFVHASERLSGLELRR